MTADAKVNLQDCPACGTAVPSAAFCFRCGADLNGPVDSRSIFLRPNVFAAAPREPIIVPRITSSLFPRLPEPARLPFRVALILLLLSMIVLSALRANGPLGVVSVLGGPLLFVMYMWQSDAFSDISRRALTIAAVTGAGLAMLYWLYTGRLLAGSYGVSTAAGMAIQNILAGLALAITIGGAVVMVLPPIMVRLLRVPVREPLDGFVIGAFGALSYMSASTLTWMLPQIVTGLLDSQSSWRMFADAVTYGIIDPLGSTALGGLVGVSLWFRPHSTHARRARLALITCTLFAAFLYLSVWVIDALSLPHVEEVAVNLVLAVLSLITLRRGVQIVLLHEAPGPTTGDPILCVHCEKVVPDTPFCVNCGAAAKASSRSSRRLRRDRAPVPEAA